MSTTNGTTEAPRETKTKRDTKPMDEEVKTMGRLNRVMEELDDADAQQRVAIWLYHRYAADPASRFFQGLKTGLVAELKQREQQ